MDPLSEVGTQLLRMEWMTCVLWPGSVNPRNSLTSIFFAFLFTQRNLSPHTTAIEKSKREDHPDLAQLQQDRLREIQMEKKAEYKKIAKEKAIEKQKAMQEKEERSYDRIMKEENMMSTADVKATVDATAAEEFEEDFF